MYFAFVEMGCSFVKFAQSMRVLCVLAPSKALKCLACCWLGQPVSKGRSKWAGLIYMASKGLGWAGAWQPF
jgi:hypothetical protein